MATYRVSVEFDLTIEDEEAARAFAKANYITMMDAALLQGEPMKDSEQLPEERVDALLDSPRAVATGVGLGFLLNGVNAGPPASVTRIMAASDELA